MIQHQLSVQTSLELYHGQAATISFPQNGGNQKILPLLSGLLLYFSSGIISHPKTNILELTRDFKTSRRLPEFRRPLDNMSLVTLVKIIALRPLTNFSQSPTFAESDRYFKILKPLAYILSTKNFLTCLNGPQGRNIPPLMSSLRKFTV